MKNINTQTNTIESGMDKIEEIKANISSSYSNKKTDKAEVYEMWDGVFEPEQD